MAMPNARFFSALNTAPTCIGGAPTSCEFQIEIYAEKTAKFGAPRVKIVKNSKKCANSLQILRAVDAQRTKNFGRRRCENILMLHNFCVELLAREMPQTRASSDRICAKFC